MFKMIKYIFTFIVAIVLFSSCSTDVDLTQEWQDIPIVYSILDLNSSTQYIRINRAFLGDDDASQLAHIPDSINYNYLLDVRVKEYDHDGNFVKEYICDTVHLWYNSDAFYSGYMPIYRFTIPNPFSIDYYDTTWLNPNYKYELVIYNPKYDKLITSSCDVIGNISITKPYSGQPYLDFHTNSKSSIEWTSAKNGRLYELLFRFYYKEVNINNPEDTLYKYIDWNLGSVKSSKLIGGENLTIAYYNQGFFDNLKNHLTIDNNINRIIGKIELIITVGDDNMATYIALNGSSSTSLSQSRPVFTNIDNGIGLFTSKRTFKRSYSLNSTTQILLTTREDLVSLNFKTDI
ncbi:MAG: hypothetical protein BWX61_01354 [Bacteroidetes bacterium ADurb.Bin035]|nr:MAG: hypothetical protein BWX61_01354 [Bacteroidetes bacterium ADurb.Bin035]HNT70165.1 hypothetical protein [Bacteroidales bacterium]HNW20613.1 hypothetical protein [Bacteroidales bacterium]HPM39999.1 hypothetical protein [Bacteroidales bacterium]